MPLEQPSAMARAFELVVESGMRSTGQLVERLCLSPAEVGRLASLPADVFGEAPAPVRMRDSNSNAAKPSGPGQLVPFRRPT